MSTQTTTYSTAGTHTFTAPSTLVGGTVTVKVYGAKGNTPGAVLAGYGSLVQATLTLAPGGVLNITVGDSAGAGFHPGGAGSAPSGHTGGHGGGSTAIVLSGTTLIEAAGGGGAGAGGVAPYGAGGAGGLIAAPGKSGKGSGNTQGGGGGGGGTQGNGAAGGTAGTAVGGGTPGAGGQSGGTVGGGGAGGDSFAASSGVSGVTYNDGWPFTTTTGAVVVSATVADAPLAPVLTGPPNGAYRDSNAAGVTFAWIYQPGTNSGTQNAYALRVLVSGAYQYYNAGSSTFGGSIVWNSSTAQTVTIPSGLLADGVNYNWSIATQENSNSLQGPFASDFVFTAATGPTPTFVFINTFSGTDPTPHITWTPNLDAGDSQTAWRVVIYTAAATLLPDFSPGVTVGTEDSGLTAGAGTGWVVPTALPNDTYEAYIQITETGSITGAWVATSFTITAAEPATPTLSATPGTDGTTGAPIITLLAQSFDNLLSTEDAADPLSGAATVGTWVATGGTTSGPTLGPLGFGSTIWDFIGFGTTTGGTIGVKTSATAYAVSGSTAYASTCAIFAGSFGRSCTLGIAWYTSGNSLISTSTGGSVTDNTTAPVTMTVAATSPSNAAWAQLVVNVTGCSTNEGHNIAQIGLFAAASAPAWSRGGLVGIETMTINYSDDGVTWLPLRGANAVLIPQSTQQISVVDNEVPFGPTRQYQAYVQASVTNPYVQSLVSVIATASAAITATQWWLTDPQDPTTVLALSRVATSGSVNTEFTTTAANTNVQVPVSVEFDSQEQSGVFLGWGNPYPIIQRGVVQSPIFTFAAYVVGTAAYATWKSLVGRSPWPGNPAGNNAPRQRTLLVRSDMGDAWYVYIGPGLADQLLRAPDRTTNPQYILTVPCTVTAKP